MKGQQVTIHKLNILSSAILFSVWTILSLVMLGALLSILGFFVFSSLGHISDGIVFAIMVTVIFPLIVGVLMFIGAIISTSIFNYVANLTKGLKIELWY